MSLKKKFAKAIGTVGLRLPSFSFDVEMMLAVDNDDATAVKELLALDPAQAGPDFRRKAILATAETPSLLEYALYNGRMEAAKAIAETAPQKLSAQNANGQTLFMRQLRNPMSRKVVEGMIALHQPQDFALLDKHGMNLMHYAARGPQAFGVEELLKVVPGLVNQADEDKRTPLMEAARHSPPAVAEALMNGGAAMHLKNSDGDNATMIAIKHSNLGTATLFLNKGGEVDFSNPAVETQMRVATSEMDTAFLEALQKRREAQGVFQGVAASPAAAKPAALK